MTASIVLITIRSLLDNSPYKHEPHQADHPEFNKYVQYSTWKSLLLDHVSTESEPVAKAFLQNHVSKHGTNMICELRRQAKASTGSGHLTSPYGQTAHADWEGTLRDVGKLVDECRTVEASRHAILAPQTPQQTVNSPCSMLVSGNNLAPIEAAKPLRTPSSTSPLLPQPDDTGKPSLLKRKHEVVDLN